MSSATPDQAQPGPATASATSCAQARLDSSGAADSSPNRPIPGRPQESHSLTVRNRHLSEETRTVPPFCVAAGLSTLPAQPAPNGMI